jgi:hypothetical protein
MTNAIHSYDNCAKAWKKITLHILHYANKVPVDLDNPLPPGTPESRNGKMLPPWFEMLPTLKYFNLAKLIGDFSTVPISAYDDLGHIVQSRMSPPPPLTEVRFEAEYLEIKRQFTRKGQFTQEMADETNRTVDRFGNYLANLEFKPRPHISLSGSGCYENPRMEGGRAVFLYSLFSLKSTSEVRPITL